MKQRSPNAVAKARDLADQEIDKLSNQSATAEERQERKERLLKGPREFRVFRGVNSRKTKSRPRQGARSEEKTDAKSRPVVSRAARKEGIYTPLRPPRWL